MSTITRWKDIGIHHIVKQPYNLRRLLQQLILWCFFFLSQNTACSHTEVIENLFDIRKVISFVKSLKNSSFVNKIDERFLIT